LFGHGFNGDRFLVMLRKPGTQGRQPPTFGGLGLETGAEL
jgi:hypothetical protein